VLADDGPHDNLAARVNARVERGEWLPLTRTPRAAPDGTESGMLLRTLPLAFHRNGQRPDVRAQRAAEVLHHPNGGATATTAAFFYTELLWGLSTADTFEDALYGAQEVVNDHLDTLDLPVEARERFDRLLVLDITRLPDYRISCDGGLIATLEAAVWSVFDSDDLVDAVHECSDFNRGAGTVAGTLAALVYARTGFGGIPEKWTLWIPHRDAFETLLARIGA
ncbi:MAG: ADP-ribosylglycohydrolase family protein, partial [Catalinimonas sp.]